MRWKSNRIFTDIFELDFSKRFFSDFWSDEILFHLLVCCVILTSPLLYRASLARTIFLYQKTFHLCRPEVFCAMKIQRCTYIQEVPTWSFDLKIASIKFLYVHNIPTVANFWRINYNMLKKDKFICRLSVVIFPPHTRRGSTHVIDVNPFSLSTDFLEVLFITTIWGVSFKKVYQ